LIHRPWPTDELLDIILSDDLPQIHTQLPPRSSGLHLSTLYHRLHPQKGNDFTEQDLRLFQLCGRAMEDRIERALVELARRKGWKAHRPGEITCGDIAGSPDIFFVEDDGLLRVGELKVAWKSTKGLVVDREGENEFPSRFDLYFTQIMGYDYMIGSNTGRLIGYFVNGDYKHRAPQLLGWDLEFNEQEICENWDALMTCRGDMEAEK
jgi:hypothetical protein